MECDEEFESSREMTSQTLKQVGMCVHVSCQSEKHVVAVGHLWFSNCVCDPGITLEVFE